jgi:hypothetical protein
MAASQEEQLRRYQAALVLMKLLADKSDERITTIRKIRDFFYGVCQEDLAPDPE